MTTTHRGARRVDAVAPFHAMAMAALATELESAGRPIVHLEVGQPWTGAPAVALDAVRRTLDRPLGYTNAPGLHALRRGIADRYASVHGVTVDAERILVVAGASAGFTLGFLAAFEPGARVGVVEPGYPCYRNTLRALDMEPVAIPVGSPTRWAPTSELVRAAGHLDGLVVASPSNPTGTVLDEPRVRELVDHAAASGVRLVVDEIYHGIHYDAPAPTFVGRDTTTIVVNSFSKYFSMTGWRVGWVVVPDDLVDAVTRLQQNLYICAPHVSQVAALAALDASEELDAHVRRYAANRALLIDGLAAVGIDDIADADGAFYVYAEVPHLTTDLGIDAMQLCRRWLDELGVAVTPGVDFDLARGHGTIRFSYAGATDDVERACELLAGWRP